MDIFVGSIPFKFIEKDLIDLFSPYGEVVSATIIINKSTRQNKGFGFVKMKDKKEALAAIAALDRSEQMGRNIIVSIAEPREEEQPKRRRKRKHKKKNIITWG